MLVRHMIVEVAGRVGVRHMEGAQREEGRRGRVGRTKGDLCPGGRVEEGDHRVHQDRSGHGHGGLDIGVEDHDGSDHPQARKVCERSCWAQQEFGRQ
jgi:hypothetical protein